MYKETQPKQAAKYILTCDCCGKTYNSQVIEELCEILEFLRFDNTGGYDNKTYGDFTHYTLDLCQYCTKELLGRFIKVHNNVCGDL